MSLSLCERGCSFSVCRFALLDLSRLTRKLLAFLANSDYLSDLDHICKCFDQNTKIRFKNENDPQFIKFGSTKDNDANVSIRFGQLKMTGKDVAQFFEPSIKCITDAVEEQMAKSSCKITVRPFFSSSRALGSKIIYSMSSLSVDSQPASGCSIVSRINSNPKGSASSVQSITRNHFSVSLISRIR